MENNNEIFDNQQENEIYHFVEKEEVKPFSLGQRLVSLITSPKALMENIKEKPVILAPFLILMLVYIPMSYLAQKLQEIYLKFTNDYILSNYGLDLAAYQNPAMAMSKTPVMQVTNTVITACVSAGSILLIAFLFLILCKIAGGKAKFKQYFSVFLHIYILAGLLGLITVALQTAFGTYLDFLSLAAVVMPNGDYTSIFYNFLSYINVSTIWITILTFIGLKTINNFSFIKTLVIIIITVIFGFIFSSGNIMLGSLKMTEFFLNMGL